ncbi:sugar ABC transporter ATP-binding protein [Microbacterium aerolatum]|uniref:sugar ABC transporter ATP-binding protein n=1 Tax=Microbacterium aerolatum TaxID=153731 RepID=UPI00384AB6AA
MHAEPLITCSGLSKRYGGVVAIKHADIELFPGEVHALLGENGAGKSTLVNILSGVVQPDTGSISVNGEPVVITNPRVSRALGISTVHQHPVVFPDLTVAENMMFAEDPPRTPVRTLDWKAVQQHAVQKMQRLGVEIDPQELVQNLSSADQQLLEIVKALSDDTSLLILDEPTAALSKHEVAHLMGVIGRLKERGVAILFVGHRLDEVFELADRVTVNRDGRTIISGPASDFTPETAVRHMVGRELGSVFPKQDVELGPVHLEVRELRKRGQYDGVSFQVRKGEILGLAGLVGAGRTEISRGIFGLDPVDSGEILIAGEPVRITSPGAAMKRRIAYVPEDRTREGAILDQSIAFNLSLAVLNTLTSLGLVRTKDDRDLSREYISRLQIRTSGPAQLISALSGGNQQKVVLGKWLATDPEILILDDPTKGVDVGAKAEVYKIVASMAQQGMAIILISNELEELLAVSDRVITFYRGTQRREFTERPFDPETVLASMTGQVHDVA